MGRRVFGIVVRMDKRKLKLIVEAWPDGVGSGRPRLERIKHAKKLAARL